MDKFSRVSRLEAHDCLTSPFDKRNRKPENLSMEEYVLISSKMASYLEMHTLFRNRKYLIALEY